MSCPIFLPQVRYGDVELYYAAHLGSDVKDVFRDAWLLAVKTKCPVRIDFNGFVRVLTEHTNTEDLLLAYGNYIKARL